MTAIHDDDQYLQAYTKKLQTEVTENRSDETTLEPRGARFSMSAWKR